MELGQDFTQEFQMIQFITVELNRAIFIVVNPMSLVQN